MNSNERPTGLDRRGVLLMAGGLIGASALSGSAFAQATPPSFPITDDYHRARLAITKGLDPKRGRIALDIPRLAESGNSVTMKVTVASPMTAADHVREIVVLSERNPIAEIARFKLSPRSGRAELTTNIRLATTQHVHAFAVMSDGTVWTADSEVIVLLAACIDGA